MSRLIFLSALVLWAGATLLLGELRWSRRRPLDDRLAVHLTGGRAPRRPTPGWSVASVREVLAPLAQDAGGRLGHLLGVSEDLGLRLERIHAEVDAAGFRLRQLGWSIVAVVVAVAVGLLLTTPPALTLLLVLGAPLLAFLLLEQDLARRSAAWQRRLFLELPVVSEQLGMLLAAGYSLGGALHRLARRGEGAVAADLRRVVLRVNQGLDEVAALREWAEIARVPAVDRLVGVLSLDREATDVGRLITDESRAARDEVHRELIEQIERRGQQVWIPVTVATLVPGVLFLAVPFIEAMRLFTTG